jgi:hypothetical protein
MANDKETLVLTRTIIIPRHADVSYRRSSTDPWDNARLACGTVHNNFALAAESLDSCSRSYIFES